MPPILPTFNGHAIQRTAAVPLITNSMEKLLLALEHNTLLDVGFELYRRAETSMLADADDRTSMQKLISGGTDGAYMDLLHSMDKETVRALIRGTVAYQARPCGNRLPTAYPEKPLDLSNVYDNGPGAYSVSVLVRGEQGKWLTADELDKVITTLTEYIDVYTAWNSWGRPNAQAVATNPGWKTQLDEAAKVDRAVRAPGRFFFLEGPGRLSQASKLRAVLQQFRRYAPATDRLAQCPQYIGCSHRVADSWSAHNPLTPGYDLQSANQLVALTVSCMKVVGLDPMVIGYPLLTCWEEDQLPVAEILLTMLAGSMCSDRGFNVIAPGGAIDNKVHADIWEQCQLQVLGISEHYRKNITESTEAAVKRQRQYKLLRDVDGHVRRMLDDAEDAKTNVIRRLAGIPEAFTEALREPLPSIRTSMVNDLAQALKLIFGPAGPPDATPSQGAANQRLKSDGLLPREPSSEGREPETEE